MLGLTGLELLQGIKIVRQEHTLGLVHREDPTLQPRCLPGIEVRGVEIDGSAPRQEDEIVEIGPWIGHKDRVMREHLAQGARDGRERGVVPTVREGHEIEGEEAPVRQESAQLGQDLDGQQVRRFRSAGEADMLIRLNTILQDPAPYYIRYNNIMPLVEHFRDFKPGQAEVFAEGRDVAILTYGVIFRECYKDGEGDICLMLAELQTQAEAA